MPTIVDDLRAAASNPTRLSKREMVDLLLAAAERIEAKRLALARVSSESHYTSKDEKSQARKV